MHADRTRWKLCLQTRGFLNHRPPTSAAHLLYGWNTNTDFSSLNFASLFLNDACVIYALQATEVWWKGTPSLFELSEVQYFLWLNFSLVLSLCIIL